jgi:hypothetical protein
MRSSCGTCVSGWGGGFIERGRMMLFVLGLLMGGMVGMIVAAVLVAAREGEDNERFSG